MHLIFFEGAKVIEDLGNMTDSCIIPQVGDIITLPKSRESWEVISRKVRFYSSPPYTSQTISLFVKSV